MPSATEHNIVSQLNRKHFKNLYFILSLKFEFQFEFRAIIYNSKPILQCSVSLPHYVHQYIQEDPSFLWKSGFIIMDSAPPWKREIQMWEKCNRLSQLKVVFVPLILPFFCETENFFICQKWGLAPSQLWINFHRKPQHQLLLTFIYHPSAHWQPNGASDASCPVHHLKGQLWDWSQSVWQGTSSPAAFSQIFGGQQRPVDIQKLSSANFTDAL